MRYYGFGQSAPNPGGGTIQNPTDPYTLDYIRTGGHPTVAPGPTSVPVTEPVDDGLAMFSPGSETVGDILGANAEWLTSAAILGGSALLLVFLLSRRH
jgi:hypothetical protein